MTDPMMFRVHHEVNAQGAAGFEQARLNLIENCNTLCKDQSTLTWLNTAGAKDAADSFKQTWAQRGETDVAEGLRLIGKQLLEVSDIARTGDFMAARAWGSGWSYT